MRKVTSKDIVSIAAMALVGVSVVGGYVYTHKARAAEVAQSTIVALRDVEQHVDITGQVEPVNKYDLSFATNGVIQKVYVKEGQSVTVGQVLAQLDVTDVAMQRAQAKAMLEGDQQTADINLQKAQQAQFSLLAADAQKLEQARQAVADAKNSLANAQDSLNNFPTPANDSPTYLSMKQGAVSAQAAYNQARKNLGVTEASIKQAETASALDIVSASTSRQLKQDTIDRSGDLSANRANLAYLDAVLGKSVLHAPANGVATVVDITEGEFATPAKPVVTVESTDVQITAAASQLDIGKLKLGDTAMVTLDAFGTDTKFAGHVDAISAAETNTSGNATYKVTLKFDQADMRIKSGMTANVSIVTAQYTNVVAVPKQAIIQTNGMFTVVVDNGSGQEKRQVTIGINGIDGYTEVTSGLQVGDHIISFGTK